MSDYLLPAAREYARAGFCVIPCLPRDKRPAIDWKPYQTARPTEAELMAWFGKGQERNIGIVTGAVSGLIVLDVDGEEGRASIRSRELPPTPCVRTGGGGLHYYYKHPGGVVRNYTQLAPGLDLRGDGGFVVAPPSIHESGQAYEWVITLDTPLADVPAWLLRLVHQPTAPQPARPVPLVIAEGRRNVTLTSLAGSMRRRGASEDAIVAALRIENAERCRPPLAEAELANIAHSVARYPPAEQPEPEHLTDLGNARRLVARHGTELLYCHNWGTWLVWDGTRWTKDQTQEVRRRAIDTVAAMYTEAAGIEDAEQRKAIGNWAMRSEAGMRQEFMTRLAQSQLPAAPEDLDQDGWLLNVQNGTIDLRSLELRPHDPAQRITKLAPVTFDPAAKCPRWEAFLDQVMAGNRALIEFLQAAVGYSLTADTAEQCFFILYGTGANGKSTFLEAVRGMLGDYGQTTTSETLLTRRFDSGIPNDLARLRGARLVTTAEVGDGRRLAEAKVKQMTGGDTMSARFMRSEFFDFRPVFKLWLATNHRPAIRGTDLAIWRRIRLAPFTVAIPESEQDKHLGDKLREELPGILNWALEGCLVWQSSGLPVPDPVRRAGEDYRAEMDTLAHFLSDRCEIREGLHVRAKGLYEAYRSWCTENGEENVTNTAFGRQLTERGFAKYHERSGTVYSGLGLRENVQGW